MNLGEASRDGNLLERRGAAGGGVAVRGLDHTARLEVAVVGGAHLLGVGLARGLSRTGNERGERVQSRFWGRTSKKTCVSNEL